MILAAWAAWVALVLSSFSSLAEAAHVADHAIDPSDAPERPRALTRTGGTGPARHRTPEMVQVSTGRDAAVRPP